ncbi:MAG: hypothetical protein ACJ8CR_11730 [Roseiflexaceae bacterium]
MPRERGIYLILRLANAPPIFLPHSAGGHFKGKDPSVDVTILQRNWLDKPIVVYIGKAGSQNGKATLKKRLWQYMEFGLGKPVGHRGGRYIWQLADVKDLLVCWKPTLFVDPAVIEKHLIQAFQAKYGRPPFANLRT